jgi:membrane protein required for colicin V production
MHWFDVCVGLAFLIGGIWSLFRGLAREIITLGGISAAFALAGWGYPSVARLLQEVIALAWLRQVASFLLIFFAAVLLYMLCATIARRMIKAVGLSIPDRLLGGLFGLLKVTVLVSAVLILLAHFAPAFASRLAHESQLAPTFFHTAQLLTTLLPEQAHADFQRFYKRVQASTAEWLPFGLRALRPPPAVRSVPPPPRRAPPQGAALAHPPSDISERDERALQNIIRERLRQP